MKKIILNAPAREEDRIDPISTAQPIARRTLSSTRETVRVLKIVKSPKVH